MADHNAFTDYLLTHLSAERYVSLHKRLQISKYRMTMLMNGTDDWKLPELQAIAKVLDRDCIDLILEYQIGQKYVTLQDINKMIQERGLKISLVQAI